ncbi:hypothetical protein KBD69_03665 [Candidatus Woesebacteria bacterium]|nr:hypothetical protein [Candidatus Woesebacteria bacterium]
MKNEIHQYYLLRMRATLTNGGADARKKLILEMRNSVREGDLNQEEFYKIFFLAMPQMGT